MKKTNSKRAFTIVELVIVIAVIAILAAVLIPTFSNIIKKAQKSSDTQLIRNLNNALAIDLAEQEQDTYPTAYEAFAAVERGGYNVSRIVAKSGYNIAYDTGHGYFVLLDEQLHQVLYPISVEDSEVTELTGEKEKDRVKYFVVRTKTSGTYTYAGDYSVYAGEDFNATEVVLNGVGFDAGKNDGITKITYTNESANAKDVVIRTNSKNTELTVNAPTDTVKHYGLLKSVEIQAVSSASYYEFGISKVVDIKNGRLVLTNAEGSSVNTIYLTSTNDNYDNIILATQTGTELPTVVQRDAVTETNGKIVCTIQSNVDEEGKNPTKTEVITIKGNDNVQENTSGYTSISELGQLILEAPTGTTGDGAAYVGNEVAVEEGKKEEILQAAQIFAGGKGTEDNPWYIIDQETFKAVGDYYDKDGFYYWEVKPGITIIDMTGWTSINLNGYIKGNNVLLSNLTRPLFENAKCSVNTNTVKDMQIVANIVRPGSWVGVLFRCDTGNDLLIDNVDISGYIEGASTWSYAGQDDHDARITLKDSTSSVTMCGTSYCGGLFGYIAQGSADVTLILQNSKYDGTMIRSNNSNFKYLCFMTNYNAKITVTLDEISAQADFSIDGSTPEAKTYEMSFGSLSGKHDYTNESKKIVGSLSISKNSNEKYEVAKGSSSKAVISLMIGPNPGNMYAGYYIEDMISDGDKWVSSKLCEVTITCDNSKEAGLSTDGKTFNVHCADGNIHCANVLVTEYDSQGNVINVGSYDIPVSKYPGGKSY